VAKTEDTDGMVQKARDGEWQHEIAEFIRCRATWIKAPPPTGPKEVFHFLELASTDRYLEHKRLEEQVKFEQDTKMLIQKGSTAELDDHREYKGLVSVLLNSILFDLKKIHGYDLTDLKLSIEAFLK
jgi:hypothetical protein